MCYFDAFEHLNRIVSVQVFIRTKSVRCFYESPKSRKCPQTRKQQSRVMYSDSFELLQSIGLEHKSVRLEWTLCEFLGKRLLRGIGYDDAMTQLSVRSQSCHIIAVRGKV